MSDSGYSEKTMPMARSYFDDSTKLVIRKAQRLVDALLIDRELRAREAEKVAEQGQPKRKESK